VSLVPMMMYILKNIHVPKINAILIQLQSMVKQIAEYQDVVHASQVKNIILHDAMDHLVVFHHETDEEHNFNAFVNVYYDVWIKDKHVVIL
jgi:hypothetical protein